MRVINKLTKPGGIRRVDINPDTVRVSTSGGQDRVYRLVKEDNSVRNNEAYSSSSQTKS